MKPSPVLAGPRVRIHFPPAESLRTIGSAGFSRPRHPRPDRPHEGSGIISATATPGSDEGDVVWEYVNPYFGARRKLVVNAVQRAYRYSAEEEAASGEGCEVGVQQKSRCRTISPTPARYAGGKPATGRLCQAGLRNRTGERPATRPGGKRDALTKGSRDGRRIRSRRRSRRR